MSGIKLGVRSWSFRKFMTNGGMTIESFLKTASEIGLDGVELLARHFPCFTFEAAKRYQKVAKEYGIKIEAIALENDYAFPDEKVRQGELENTYFWIRMAAYSGVPYLKIFTGDTDDSVSYDTQRGWVLESLRKAAEYAAAYGVVILVENHSLICFTYQELKALILEVNHPACRLCPDVYNFSKLKAEPIVYEAAKELIPLSPYGHLQFYEMDETGRELHMDMKRLMGIYDSVGYEGFLMLEWEGESDALAATTLQAEYIRSIIG